MTKYTNAIITGDIKIPKISPNLIHILFNGESNFELINPSKRKIIEMAKKYLFKFSPFFKGQILKIKKNKKNNIPKLLFELLDFIKIY